MLRTGAYFEGTNAFAYGQSVSNCPYVEPDLASMWVAGYMDSFADAMLELEF